MGKAKRCDASRRFFIKAMPESGGDSDMGKRISNIRGSQPRLATLDSPFQRKGLSSVLSVSTPPSFGRRCPQGGVKDDVRLSIFLGKYGSIAVRFYF